MIIRVRGDSKGYVPDGFVPGRTATIIGFLKPDDRGSTDHIVVLSDSEKVGHVKPSNIDAVVSEIALDMLSMKPVGSMPAT